MAAYTTTQFRILSVELGQRADLVVVDCGHGCSGFLKYEGAGRGSLF